MYGWNASNTIALVALFVPIVKSVSDYFVAKKKAEVEKEISQLKARKAKYENQIKAMQDTFMQYAIITQREISDSQSCLDSEQQELSLKVLMFANDDLSQKIQSFNAICSHLGYKSPKVKAFRKVIQSYRQFMIEQQDQRYY